MALNREPLFPDRPGPLGLGEQGSQGTATQPKEIELRTLRPKRRWPRRLLSVLFALLTFEIGLFLIVFPWTERWDFNYFQQVIPGLQDLWEEPSFRGALTGLGLINVYIACLQVIHLIRRS